MRLHGRLYSPYRATWRSLLAESKLRDLAKAALSLRHLGQRLIGLLKIFSNQPAVLRVLEGPVQVFGGPELDLHVDGVERLGLLAQQGPRIVHHSSSDVLVFGFLNCGS